jgi:hypothetical protein
MSKKPAPKPWHPAPYSDADTLAIKALHEGNANEGQQRRALKWIIETLCGTYDQPFRPGEDGARETDFACAKMFVGQQIVKQIKLPMPARMSR